jgi:GTP-binding protein
LARALVLIDSRRGVKDIDIETMKALDASAVSYAVVLTKIDQVKAGDRAALEAATLEHLRKRPAAYPKVFITSSEDGEGIAELRAAIFGWLEERSSRV